MQLLPQASENVRFGHVKRRLKRIWGKLMVVKEIKLVRIVYSETEPKATVYFRIYSDEGPTLDVSGTVDCVDQAGDRIQPSWVVRDAATGIGNFLKSAGAKLVGEVYS